MTDTWVPKAALLNRGHREDANPIARYCYLHSVKLHPAQEKLIHLTEKEQHGGMLGAPEEMQLFQNLLHLLKAKHVLDVGVFTGFSSLSMALALPDGGKVFALDKTDEFAKRCHAFEIWKEAGVDKKIEFKLGDGAETMKQLLETMGKNSFDFAFIDADKPAYATYYDLAMQLVRPGGIIALDNTLWGESVLDPNNKTPDAVAVRALNDKLAKDDRISITFLSMADGVTLCFKK